MDRSLKQPKAGKKRKLTECPNPLFLKWLENWRDEAKAKESKMQYVYSKAISSLKKYPLPLINGAEATILDGVGPGIAKRLDEELEKHNCNLQNNVVVDLPDDDIAELDFPDLRVPPPPNVCVNTTSPNVNGTPESSTKPKKKRKSSPRKYVPVYRSGPYAMMMALLKASERIGYKGYLTKTEIQQQAQPYTETSFTVPEPDSYYTAWSSMSTLVKKGLVMRSGNPARFSLTGMGHELAEKLTTATAEHNTTMRSPTTSQGTSELLNNSFSPPTTPKTRGLPKPRTPIPTSRSIRCPASTSLMINTSPEKNNSSHSPYGNPSKDFLASYRYKTSGTEVMPTHLGSLKFWYVGSDGECVEHRDKAAVIIDDEISFGYLIKCRKSELDKAKVKYKHDQSRQSKDGHVFVYIDNESISEQSALTAEDVTKKSNVKSSGVTGNGSDSSDDEILMKPLFERLGVRSGNEIKTQTVPLYETVSATTSVEVPEIISITESACQPKLPNALRPITSESNMSKTSSSITIKSMSTEVKQPIQEEKPTEIKQSLQEKQALKEKQPSQTKQPAESKQPTQPKAPTLTSLSSLTAAKEICLPNERDTSNKVEKIIIPEFELNPGSFEIILCVDFIETTGGSKTIRKEEMVKELRMNGVYFDVRKLNVGDFLWVAREKMLPVPGQLVLPERRELVLDYIVERKRMDDLCSSIKDGRFKEQKFRLLNSGLRHPVYLVEDFGSMNFLSMPAQTLEQAIINTQVGQEFFVKRTRDIKESAAYLTLMTRYLQSVYDNQTLKAIKREDMEYVEVKENQVNTHLMTFQELNDISIKNRVLTVGELFGKQLLQIPGVAAEKVVGILELYPTLRDLLDAYEEQTTEKEKENLLSDVKYGKAQRKIGPSVSKTIYQLYCTKGALS